MIAKPVWFFANRHNLTALGDLRKIQIRLTKRDFAPEWSFASSLLKWAAIFLFGISLHAHPTNPVVVAGEARWLGGGDWTIEAADRTILDWDDFSIGSLERVQFVLPSADSVVVNRVKNSKASTLFGRLESNGRVVWINPHGIWIGETGVVDAASFIASTLEIHKGIFLERGELAFREISWGMVVNHGLIRADVALLSGFEVQNGAEIEAREVGLVAAKELWLQKGLKKGLMIRTRFTSEESVELREKIEAERSLGSTPYRLPEDQEWPVVVRIEPIEMLNMPGPTVIQKGRIQGEEVQLLGDYIDVRRGSLTLGERVFAGKGKGAAKRARIARIGGDIHGSEKVVLCGEGALVITGNIWGEREIFSPGYFLDRDSSLIHNSSHE